MLTRSTLTAVLFLFSVMACEESTDQSLLSISTEESIENTSARQMIHSKSNSENKELSCLQLCGQQARSTIYSACLSDGGEQQKCASTGRQWYRECLETQCDESAIQEDDCKTVCRLNKKEQYQLCVSETEQPEECRSTVGEEVRTCVLDCE